MTHLISLALAGTDLILLLFLLQPAAEAVGHLHLHAGHRARIRGPRRRRPPDGAAHLPGQALLPVPGAPTAGQAQPQGGTL